jgi:glycosyltransferase involved in cell wall biosynthesis
MLVSILIPAFNAERWIAETLRSAVSQTWDAKEIIVVDDGSTDRTGDISRQFPVRVVRQQNQGAAEARNVAFALSRGEFIQWLDADDVLAPDKIERQMVHSGDPRMLLSSPWAEFMFRRSVAEARPTALWADLTPQEWLFRKVAQNLWMPPCTWLVSRELTEAAGPWDRTMYVDDDGEYFCRVIAKSSGVRFVPDAKSYYRHSGSGSLSRIGRSKKKMGAQFRSLELHIAHLLSFGDTEQARQACVSFLRVWLPTFIPDRPDLADHARELAAELGGRLDSPRLSWKYDWIRAAFGWNLAKHAQVLLPNARLASVRLWDRLLYQIQSQRGQSESF